MPAVNPEATRTTQSSAPDTQTLIGLLDSLMPLLRQLQSQSQAYAGQAGFAPIDATSFSPVAPPSPMIDHQAAAEMIEDMNASALRMLQAYLESYASQHAALTNCIAMVTQAARCFALHDHAQTFALVWQAYRAVASARLQDQELPPLRVALQDSPQSPPASLH